MWNGSDTPPPPSRTSRPIVVVGAGIGGLVAALLLGAAGHQVTLAEKGDRAGGKLRRIEIAGHGIESGPTVLTMRWVFEAIFRAVGERFEDRVRLKKAEILARHVWPDGSIFDLNADPETTAEAVAEFAGRAEADGFRAFLARAKEVFGTLDASFIEHPSPSIVSLTRSAGLSGLGPLMRIRPFTSLWNVVARDLSDPRLRQLLGRYATYCGSSPYAAPGPLTLIPHVEQEGVWLVEGGLTRIAEVLEQLALERGVTVRYGAEVATIEVKDGRASGVSLACGERIEADAVVFNGDPAALFGGLLGPAVRHAVPAWTPAQRSLSALTWSMRARATGFPLSHHSVFFSADYAREFDDLFVRGRLPEDPTIYVCAQDRDASDGPAPEGPESLFVLVNAPANADTKPLSEGEIAACLTRVMERLAQAGLKISDSEGTPVTTGPAQFATMYPGSGGALYGRASHGWTASFRRPGARTRIRGLTLAGGATHPGPGIPMAALSGRHAALATLAHLASTGTSRATAMPGGISTPSAAMAETP